VKKRGAGIEWVAFFVCSGKPAEEGGKKRNEMFQNARRKPGEKAEQHQKRGGGACTRKQSQRGARRHPSGRKPARRGGRTKKLSVKGKVDLSSLGGRETFRS